MSEETEERTERQRQAAELISLTSLGLAAVGAVSFGVVYWLGEDHFPTFFNQALGLSATVALLGIGFGLVVWTHGLMPQAAAQERRIAGYDPQEERQVTQESREGLRDSLERGASATGRRRLLGRVLVGVLGIFGLTALFPLRSLGTRPSPFLRKTPWSPGAKLVREDGRQIRVGDVDYGEIVTAFPEGFIGDPQAQVVLLRIPRNVFRPVKGREDWAPEGYVAYSKLCTHAGCPVGLYQVYSHRLFCPCHQATFEAADGARPSFGPAKRPLPQLPLAVEDGFLVAQRDFDLPVGSGYWNYYR